MSRRISCLESFKNSLRLSLREATGLLPAHKVRLGTFNISASFEALLPDYTNPPEHLDLLYDYEFEIGEWTRLYFHLELLDGNALDDWGNLICIYRATAEF